MKPSERIKEIAEKNLWEASGKTPEVCWGEAIVQYLDEQAAKEAK